MENKKLELEEEERKKKLEIERQESQKRLEMENKKLELEEEERKKKELEEEERKKKLELDAARIQAEIDCSVAESKRKTRQAAVDEEFRQLESERNYELQRLQSEAKNRHENEISARESETQIRLAQINSSSSKTSVVTQDDSNLSCRQVRDLPPLKSLDREDIENYLTQFERLCKLNNIPENKYCAYIASKLPYQLVEILTRVPVSDASNYTLFKENVSRKYLLNSDFFKKRFYALNIQVGDSNAEFFRKLKETFDRWLQSEKVGLEYIDLYNFFILQRYFQRIDTDKYVYLRERDLSDIDQIAKAADVYDVAHLRENDKKKVFNSFSKNNNFSVNHTGTNPPISEKPSCTFCGKRNHTSDTCFKKNTEKGPTVCSHCHKPNHTAETCFALHGKPSTQGKTKNGPQPSSTFKGKQTHPVAAVNVCELPKHYTVFENSSINNENTHEENTKYSFLQGTDETEVYTSCTIISTNQRNNDKQILNPYSKAKIEGSEELQTVLRDSGSFVSIIRRDLVPIRCYTNRTIGLQFADGRKKTVPTALIKIDSNFFSGVMEFAILENPVSPVIIGNMPHVTENFSNRNFENEISEKDIQQKTVINPITHENKQTEVIQTTNQSKIELKLKNEQKIEISPGAKVEKWRKPEKIETEQNKSKISLNNSFMNNKEQKQMVFENKTMKINTTDVSSDTNFNMVSTKHALNINEQNGEQSSMSLPNRNSLSSGNINKPELTTLIDYDEQSHIPIGAVLTRSKARAVEDIKMPNLLLQIPDISTEKFKEMQKGDKNLERFWKIAQDQTNQDETLKATFMIKKGLLYRKPIRPRGLGDSSETQLVIPSDLRYIVLKTAHESVLGCHMSTKKTTQRIQVNFWFEGIVSYTHRYCKSCDVCQKTIKHGKVAKAPMLISKLSVEKRPTHGSGTKITRP